MMDWQPIERAPATNGFTAILWNGQMMYVGTLDASLEVFSYPVWCPHLEEGEYSPSSVRPTHWMPAPEPPATE
jgi:hypothetical protein